MDIVYKLFLVLHFVGVAMVLGGFFAEMGKKPPLVTHWVRDGALLQMDAPEALRHAPASKQVAAFLGYRAFLTEHQARSLGWHGALPVGSVLGLGASSLVLDEAGVEVAVVDQGYTPDDVEIGVRLPDGQRATVSSPERIDAPTVRVRLVGGAVTPA